MLSETREAGRISGVAVRPVGDEAEMQRCNVSHGEDALGGGDGDGPVFLVYVQGLAAERGGCGESHGAEGNGGDSEEVHSSSPVLVRRSARVFLCFGLAAAFCLGSGRIRSGGGEPTAVRALSFTAFTFENVCFLGLLMASLSTCSGLFFSTFSRLFFSAFSLLVFGWRLH